MPRVVSSSKPGKVRHDPLHIQLQDDEFLEKYGRVTNPNKRKSKKSRPEDESNDPDAILDAKTSRKIFELAKDQQDELEMPDDEDDDEEEPGFAAGLVSGIRSVPTYDDEEEEEEIEEIEYIDEDGDYAGLQIDPSDLSTLEHLMPSNAGARRTLADMILEKLDSADAGAGKTVKFSTKTEEQKIPDAAAGLDPKVVAVYTKIGVFLKSYRAGPIPKPFKILPTIPSWARLLSLTSPTTWSPHATYAATRLLISGLKPPQARVYLEGVLLDAVRENIRDNGGKLNVHLYEALKRSLYKPAAFFKGILFPLCENACTLKEAAIVASVLARVSVPILHSAAALLRLANMEYTGPNSLFIRVLLDKKYALPYKVVDGVWHHFVRLANTYKGSLAAGDKLPVLWHQSLLVFCQRYASDMTPEQKDALLDVVRVRPHHQIGPEIRRELVNSVCRGEARPGEDAEMR
ncbi:hypothetical protein BOTBODRAFT_50695 [Botryobasidium botryosum FD-172 SS1]|uniref:Bystin-domain-containing protein n=1 Tax=Botryobasidium botryosum (strain FD-172 SS1) TaxID=930990 RepID=A0A067MXY6_BOTB1|nr:hypothetical protein BOTBODRAFT_50695 [Botryobasidium botryosum FD-172 SS1]